MTYIDPRGKAVRHMDRLVAWRQGYMPGPVTVEWDLSNRCVLGCQDCHFAHTHVRGPWAVGPRMLPMAYDSTGDLADTGVVRRGLREMASPAGTSYPWARVRAIVWSGGGEPTTHPDWIEIVEHAHGLGLEQGMYTLGGLLTEDTARRLSAVAKWVVVSLDACDAETYAAEKGVKPDRFDKAIEGIRWLVGGPAVIGVSFLLHGGNWRRAYDMLALARWLGATYTTFRPAIRTSPDRPSVCTDDRAWITDAMSMLRHLSITHDVEIDVARFVEYRDWKGHGYGACSGIRLNTTVTPDGRVWICPQRRGLPGSCLGDLTHDSFDSIWRRHPSEWTVDASCRVMCRLHPVNQQLAALDSPCAHEAFV